MTFYHSWLPGWTAAALLGALLHTPAVTAQAFGPPLNGAGFGGVGANPFQPGVGMGNPFQPVLAPGAPGFGNPLNNPFGNPLANPNWGMGGLNGNALGNYFANQALNAGGLYTPYNPFVLHAPVVSQFSYYGNPWMLNAMVNPYQPVQDGRYIHGPLGTVDLNTLFPQAGGLR